MKMVVEYFPELDGIDSKYSNKYGISNLSLVKDGNVLTGYSWRYTYYDGYTEKVKFISSYDLKKLRKKVESKGFDWRVTDLEMAKETYKLNDELVAEHERIRSEHIESKGIVAEHTISKCGVQYVYLNDTNQNSYWTYRDKKHKTLTRRYLSDLKKVVEDKGYDWIVKDKTLYESILEKERLEKG